MHTKAAGGRAAAVEVGTVRKRRDKKWDEDKGRGWGKGGASERVSEAKGRPHVPSPTVPPQPLDLHVGVWALRESVQELESAQGEQRVARRQQLQHQVHAVAVHRLQDVVGPASWQTLRA